MRSWLLKPKKIKINNKILEPRLKFKIYTCDIDYMKYFNAIYLNIFEFKFKTKFDAYKIILQKDDIFF